MKQPFAAATPFAAVVLLILIASPAIAATQPTTVTTAPAPQSAELPRRDAVIAVMRKAADYQLAEFKKPKPKPVTTTKPAATTPATTKVAASKRAATKPATTKVATTKPYEETDNDWV